MFERSVAEAVVRGPLILIFQDVVGFVDFLELVLALMVARIAIRVKLLGELAVSALDLFDRGGLLATECVVVAALHGRNTECGTQGSDSNEPIPYRPIDPWFSVFRLLIKPRPSCCRQLR